MPLGKKKALSTEQLIQQTPAAMKGIRALRHLCRHTEMIRLCRSLFTSHLVFHECLDYIFHRTSQAKLFWSFWEFFKSCIIPVKHSITQSSVVTPEVIFGYHKCKRGPICSVETVPRKQRTNHQHCLWVLHTVPYILCLLCVKVAS